MSQSLMAIFISLLPGCSSEDVKGPVDCSLSSLTLVLQSTTDASSCTSADGAIALQASGGEGPYTFEMGGAKNDMGAFDGLAAGNYEAKVTDSNSCTSRLGVSIKAAGSDLGLVATTVADTGCLSGNGAITITGQGGMGPFVFRINNGPFGTTSTFPGLKAGEYSVAVKDGQGCVFIDRATIARGETGVSFSAQIKPIIDTKCALSGCHNGDNGANRNWTIFGNVKANAGNIKTRTGNRSMPLTGSLTQDQIDLIACWVDDGAKDN